MSNKLQFWGKLMGDEQDYLIAYGLAPAFGFPKKKFYFCTTSNFTLKQLPELSEEYVKKSLAVGGRFKVRVLCCCFSTQLFMCTCVYLSVYLYAYIYTYIHICIYMYTYTGKRKGEFIHPRRWDRGSEVCKQSRILKNISFI